MAHEGALHAGPWRDYMQGHRYYMGSGAGKTDGRAQTTGMSSSPVPYGYWSLEHSRVHEWKTHALALAKELKEFG